MHIIEETTTTLRCVKTKQSPYLDMFTNNQPIKIIIDSEATRNMIQHAAARHLGMRISNSTQSARQMAF